MVLSHKTYSVTNIKPQQLQDETVAMDCAVVMILCPQETKIPALTAPTGYIALRSVRQTQQGKGIATLVPQALDIL